MSLEVNNQLLMIWSIDFNNFYLHSHAVQDDQKNRRTDKNLTLLPSYLLAVFLYPPIIGKKIDNFSLSIYLSPSFDVFSSTHREQYVFCFQFTEIQQPTRS